MSAIELTNEEYNAILKSRNMIFESELDSILRLITAFDEDVMSNSIFDESILMEVEALPDKQDSNNEKEEDKSSNKDKESFGDKAKKVSQTIVEKIKKLFEIVKKFVTNIIPNLFDKIKGFMDKNLDKVTTKPCEFKYIRDKHVMTAIRDIDRVDNIFKYKQDNTNQSDNAETLKAAYNDLNNIRQDIENKSPVAFDRKFLPSGILVGKLQNQLKTTMDNVKSLADKTEEKVSKLQSINYEDTPKGNAIAMVLSTYSAGYVIFSTQLKCLVAFIKNLNSSVTYMPKQKTSKVITV